VPPPASPTVRRRRLAAELRRLRESRDFTLDDVADRLQWSASKLSRIENAKTGAKPIDVRRLLELYRVTGTRADDLLALAREAEKKGWWEAFSDALPDEYSAFIGLEAEATFVAHWETKIIPGLLQTEDYARQTVLSLQPIVGLPPGQVEARVEARMRRQSLLMGERALELSVVLDESVLLRDFGGQKLMYDQLQRLIEIGHLPNVNLQVRPFASAQPPPGVDSFELLRFGPTYHDVVFADMLSRGIYFEEDLDTYHFSLTFDRLRNQALDPGESEKLIARIADQNWR
jgi:transcriptional regulator with XRE-family HTH domain